MTAPTPPDQTFLRKAAAGVGEADSIGPAEAAALRALLEVYRPEAMMTLAQVLDDLDDAEQSEDMDRLSLAGAKAAAIVRALDPDR